MNYETPLLETERLLLKKEENSWVKNGIEITSYTCILSRERFNELYSKEVSK